MIDRYSQYKALAPESASKCTMIRGGSADVLASLLEKLSRQSIDEIRLAPEGWQPPRFRTTLAGEVSVTGPATYCKGKMRTLQLIPEMASSGWCFQRRDLSKEAMPPIECDSCNVASASRAIILRRGVDSNRMRMTEHIICQRLGLGVDDLTIHCESDDPPLFDEGSIDLVKAMVNAGKQVKQEQPLEYCTVTAPVAILHPNQQGFLLWEPPVDESDHRFYLDVAIDFKNAIGQQRIVMELCESVFQHGAVARTNCPFHEVLFARFLGWTSSYLRNLGYTNKNILIAKQKEYYNPPLEALNLENGKSLEAVWHRACLDLIAALSLINNGRPCGRVTSYRAGHVLDTDFVRHLTQGKFLGKC